MSICIKDLIADLEQVIGYTFTNSDLMLTAITHPSYRAEQKVQVLDNQRMEFLGDAVVELIVSKALYAKFPNKDEGAMSQMRSSVTNRFPLSNMAKQAELGRFIMLSKGEQKSNGAERESTLCDAFEALVAAIYIDGGFDAADQFFWDIFEKCEFDLEHSVKSFNPKGAVQEYTQKVFRCRPEYILEKVEGPEHEPEYQVILVVNGEEWSRGVGANRKLAETRAADAAMHRLV